MSTIPKLKEGYRAIFNTPNGEIEGVYEAYWCGSDCPCGWEAPLDAFPDCWGVATLIDDSIKPIGWRDVDDT